MPLPPGPRAPAAIQTFAWWNRSVPFFERCRARYGRRFTIRLLSTPPFVMLTDPEQIPPWTEAQLIGSPDTVAERVQAFVDAGFDHIILHTVVPGTPRAVQWRWAERFATEVAPRFSQRFAAAAAA